MIKLNTAAPEQGEPPDHGHYPFSLSDPETIVIVSSKEKGKSAKIYVSASSKKENGYSRMGNGSKVCHFLHGIKSPELEAVVNVVHAQPEKYGTDFDVVAFYLGQMVMKKGLITQSVLIAIARS